MTSWWPISPCWVRVIAEWIRRKVCPAPVCAHMIGNTFLEKPKEFIFRRSRRVLMASRRTVGSKTQLSDCHDASPSQYVKISHAVMCDVWMERLYQHVARHRYAASGSQPDFFFPLSLLPAAELETSPVNFTVNECSSSVCLIPHVLEPVLVLIASRKHARISSGKHDIRGWLSEHPRRQKMLLSWFSWLQNDASEWI